MRKYSASEHAAASRCVAQVTLQAVQGGASSAFYISGLDGAAAGPAGELLAAACSDGAVRLLSAGGEEVESAKGAHSGAATCARWNHTGTAFASGGEDGAVKVWSSAALLRETVVLAGHPVHALAWSPDSSSVRPCCGRRPGARPLACHSAPGHTDRHPLPRTVRWSQGSWVAEREMPRMLCTRWGP